MILIHMAPSSLNMSSYRTIWTHFRSILAKKSEILVKEYEIFPKCKSPHLAILVNI